MDFGRESVQLLIPQGRVRRNPAMFFKSLTQSHMVDVAIWPFGLSFSVLTAPFTKRARRI